MECDRRQVNAHHNLSNQFDLYSPCVPDHTWCYPDTHLRGQFREARCRFRPCCCQSYFVRISSVEALSSAIEVAVACSTRALDHPDVPLLISSIKFIVNIVLDLLIISRFHVGNYTPTINTQALIRMACDLTSAISGLVYFLYIAAKPQRHSTSPNQKPKAGFTSLKTLARPGIWTFTESALRNSIYLWLIHGIVSMGLDYATAWGVFNTIRWGIFMVPVQALEATTLTFVGHAWGKWRAEVGPTLKNPKASKQDLLGK